MNMNSWYQVKSLSDSIKMIREPLKIFPDLLTNNLNLFSITDGKETLLLDTGTGVFSYKAFVKLLLGRDMNFTPLTTHSHFDHVGSLYEFNQSLIHASEMDSLALEEDLGFLYPMLDSLEAKSAKFENYNFRRKAVPTSRLLKVEDKDWVAVGKKEIQIIHVPGHSPGSLAVYYPEEHMLFTGDSFQVGYVYIENVQRFKQSLEKLLNFLGSEQIFLIPSHEKIWLTDDNLLELLTLLENYLNNDISAIDIRLVNNRYIHNNVLFSKNFNLILPVD